jgi:AbrB family looped-hinge helix DNA binding protein
MNVKLSQKGWVVIPATMRNKYGLKPGANLQVVDYGGVLAIVPGQRGSRFVEGWSFAHAGCCGRTSS